MSPRLRRAALPVRRAGPWRPALLGVLLLLVLALPATTLAWDSKAFSASDESLLVSLVNQRRASAELGSLATNSTLTSVARSRSRKMGDSHTLSHTIGGRSAFDDLRAAGYCFLEGAENLAWNTYPDGQATRVAWQSWLSSSGHLANILGRAYTRIGVGAYKAADGTHVYVMLVVRACGTTATRPSATAAPRRTSAPTRPPAVRSTPFPTTAPVVVASPEVTVPPGPRSAPDALRQVPASGDDPGALERWVEELLELVNSLLDALARPT